MSPHSVFHVAADIVDTEIDATLGAFAGLPYTTRKKNSDELRVNGDDLSFDIYAMHDDVGEERHFLVSGEIEGSEAEVKASVRAIADSLAAHGIVYNFDIDEIDNPVNSFVIRPPMAAVTEGAGMLVAGVRMAVVLTVAGEAIFATGWEDWDDMPEVVALRKGHRGAPLAQPLL